MSHYAIGDIQGCFFSFEAILRKINFNSKNDRLYLLGDLVNRGPASLEMLNWVYQNQACTQVVLGNHDLYCIGRYEGLINIKAKDTLEKLLNHPHASQWIDFLCKQAPVIEVGKYLLMHAGFRAGMNLEKILETSLQIQNFLNSNQKREFLSFYFSKEENLESPLAKAAKYLKLFTRIRCVDENNLMTSYSGEYNQIPLGQKAWFETIDWKEIGKKILFGHWSALGLYQDENVLGLDTGCVWGRKLSAFNLETKEIIQVDAHENYSA